MNHSINAARIFLALIWCWCAISLIESADQQQIADKLELVCKDKVDVKTIAKFKQFMKDLRSIAQNEQQLRSKNDKKNLIKCLEERESFEALEQLIDSYDQVRPCKMSEVEKLEQFARKHLLKNKKALAGKFFSLFGVQIALSCKLNLMAHTKQADLEADQLDFIYAMASPTGWNVLVNEFTKKSMKFGTSAHADSHVINRVARLVPGLTQIDQLDYLNFDHLMNHDDSSEMPKNWDAIERGQYEPQSVELRGQLVESIVKIIASCQALDMFYVNSLLAMSRLKELGLMVDYLNELHEHSATLHKWLAATSFCQLMARVKLVTTSETSSDSALHFEIIHDDKLLVNRRKLYSYVAPFDEITDRAREFVWHASGVNEGAWRRKGESMWPPGCGGTSVAMRQLKQFIKGVEHNFKEVEEEKQAEAG